MRWILCYWFPKMSSSQRIQFKRELFGSNEKTLRGKYSFVKKGYLSDKEYEKPIRSVLILSDVDKSRVQEIITVFGGKYVTYQIAEK